MFVWVRLIWDDTNVMEIGVPEQFRLAEDYTPSFYCSRLHHHRLGSCIVEILRWWNLFKWVKVFELPSDRKTARRVSLSAIVCRAVVGWNSYRTCVTTRFFWRFRTSTHSNTVYQVGFLISSMRQAECKEVLERSNLKAFEVPLSMTFSVARVVFATVLWWFISYVHYIIGFLKV